jgi:hypothetical protein
LTALLFTLSTREEVSLSDNTLRAASRMRPSARLALMNALFLMDKFRPQKNAGSLALAGVFFDL